MNDKKIYFIILVVVLIGLGVWVYINREEAIEVNSYEECEAAGYPIMESYPRQCSAPDGRTFTEEVEELPVEVNFEDLD